MPQLKVFDEILCRRIWILLTEISLQNVRRASACR